MIEIEIEIEIESHFTEQYMVIIKKYNHGIKEASMML
jgi:hypothetical protein